MVVLQDTMPTIPAVRSPFCTSRHSVGVEADWMVGPLMTNVTPLAVQLATCKLLPTTATQVPSAPPKGISVPLPENVSALVCCVTLSGGEPPQPAIAVNVNSHQRFVQCT